MLSVTSASKRFGSLQAVDALNLEVGAGEFFGLLGPNGAGKSTLMSLIAGLRAPDSGAIAINGRKITPSDPGARASLGLVPQNLALYTELSAEQNLAIFGGLYGLSGRTLARRVEKVLEAVRLKDRKGDRVRDFSGGMQRRLNLAAALLHEPTLLLCDEPTVGVDPQSRNAIFEFLEERNREGLTIIYSTHYMEEAERLCGRIGIIDQGKILAEGSLDSLLERLPFEEEIRFPLTQATEALASTLGGEGEFTHVDGETRFRPRAGFKTSRFYEAAESLGLPARLFTTQRPSLEAVFLKLTGRNLRE